MIKVSRQREFNIKRGKGKGDAETKKPILKMEDGPFDPCFRRDKY